VTATVPPGRSPVDAPDRRLAFHAARIGLAAALAVLTFVLFPSSPAIDFPIYEVGSVASDNVIAPFAYTVLKSPDELAKEQNDIARSVEPIFSLVPAALDTSRGLVEQFASGLRRISSTTDGQRAAALSTAGLIWLERPDEKCRGRSNPT